MMYSHQPANYECPFCAFLAGEETEYKRKQDIVYQDDTVTAFISPKAWEKNPGNVVVIPNQHYENIYDIPDGQLAAVYQAVKKIATALKAVYGCDGTSTRQHNEPAGNQEIWHFHVHVFPRYHGDRLYQNHDTHHFVAPEKRLTYAEKLRKYFEKLPS